MAVGDTRTIGGQMPPRPSIRFLIIPSGSIPRDSIRGLMTDSWKAGRKEIPPSTSLEEI